MAKDQGWQLQEASPKVTTAFYSKVRRAARIADARRREYYSELGEDYESWTKQELYKKAREKGVPGRSNMNKRDLVRALRRY